MTTTTTTPALDELDNFIKQASALRELSDLDRAREARRLTPLLRSAMSQVGNEAALRATLSLLPSDNTRTVGRPRVAQALGITTSTLGEAIDSYRAWLRHKDRVQLILSGE